MKIAIIGAGITGLSIGKLLSEKHEIHVLEKDPICGGIAKTKLVQDIAYHTIGGHCFNSRHKEVLDFVFDILPKKEWHEVKRNACIAINSFEVPYPIEFSIKEIYQHDRYLAINILSDFLATTDFEDSTNLEDWFRKKFGTTLAELYFIPYNEKVWKRNLSEMNSSWVKDKLPIPSKESVLESLFTTKVDNMPHNHFYYPNSNNQNTLIESIGRGLNITTNFHVKSISFNSDYHKWAINKELYFDRIINTSPLNQLPFIIENSPEEIRNAARKLKYNPVSNVLWKSKPTSKTWTYFPNGNLFHRYIHIGNFSLPNINYTITEAIGNLSFQELTLAGKNDPFLLEPIDHFTSEHAYIVFDENYNSAKTAIKNYLNNLGIDSIGRFGDWDYYNMDICIKQSMDLSKKYL